MNWESSILGVSENEEHPKLAINNREHDASPIPVHSGGPHFEEKHITYRFSNKWKFPEIGLSLNHTI